MYPLYEVFKLLTVRMLAYNSGTPAVLIEIPGYLNSINGAIAGAIAGFLTTPLDVLKTRLMTFQVAKSKKKTRTGIHHQIIDEIKKIYNEEGVRGLFKGAQPRMLYVIVGGFVYFGVFEYIKINSEAFFAV